MIASAIRELSASKEPRRIAAAFFEDTVQIWDLDSRERVNELSTVFCGGARALALAPSARVLAVGRSGDTGNVAGYDAQSGRVLWQRRVAYPSFLRFQPSGESLVCSSNEGLALRLDVNSGETLEVFKGLKRVIEGPYGDRLDVPPRDAPFRLLSRRREIEILQCGIGLLDAQFSPEAVCLAEARGPVRCVGCSGGGEQWRFDPGASRHVLRLHYSEGINAFFGILRGLVKDEGRYLLRFDARDGTCEQICKLESWEQVFIESSDQIVTASGEIRELSDGALVGRLPFPVKEYPVE
jgi:hypothetical protein